MHSRLTAALLIAITTVLAGCDVKQRFASPEDRINAEVPLTIELRQAHERFVEQLAEQPAARAELDKAWMARMRVRALSCSPDYTPSWTQSREAVRAAVKDKACFTAFDRKLQRWVGLQRVRRALTLPPLAVPEGGSAAATLTFPGAGIAHSRTLGAAPVIALSTTGGFELVSLIDGRSLLKEQGPASELNIAPNGRLFAQPVAGAVRIRMCETGETLLELAEASAVSWLGPHLLAVRGSFSKPQFLIGLQRGEELPLPLPQERLRSGVMFLPVPGEEKRFNLLSSGGAYQFEFKDEEGSPKFTLIRSKPAGTLGMMLTEALPLSGNGQEMLLGYNRLYRFNLASLEMQETTFEPIQIMGATLTAVPDQFVVNLMINARGGSASRQNGYYLFDAGKGTLARVDSSINPGALRYLPAVRRFAQAQDAGVQLLESLPTAEAEPAERVIAAMLDEANQLILKQAVATAERERAEMTAALPPDSPLAAQMRGADVEGIGVYESKERSAQPGFGRVAGKVRVHVRRSSRPLVLVLSSYESVQWELQLEPGARLAAVLLSGYKESSVQGAGAARVLKIGGSYAYKHNDEQYRLLQSQVQRWVGKSIGVFQGEYAGASFSVGGP